MTNFAPMTCAEFDAQLTDYIDGALTARENEAMEMHRLDCAECDAIAADLLKIRSDAGKLPLLTPERDLWDGIASRIEAEVVSITPLPGTVPAMRPAEVLPVNVMPLQRTRVATWKVGIAAGLLVAVTAGVTWKLATQSAAPADAPNFAGVSLGDTGFATAMAGTRNVRLSSGPAMNESYDREISALRKIVDERRSDLDSATVAVLEKNLKVIDQAIAESKAALAGSPASAFLLDQLADAYDSKLRMLRAVATLPVRG